MSGQNVGYIRVSTAEQNAGRQLEGLKLDKVFSEKISGRDTNRPQLWACLEYVREGDTLHIHSLDRLGRSLLDLEHTVSELVNKGVTVKFHKENLVFNRDGSNSMGKLLFQILGAFAEFERNLIKERQAEGLARAKARGKHLGRPPKLTREQKEALLRDLHETGESVGSLARRFGVSRGTIYNLLSQEEENTVPADGDIPEHQQASQ